MATNRLYIVDEDGDKFLLAKALGKGWYPATDDDNQACLDFVWELEAFLRPRDGIGTLEEGVTTFRLMTEYELLTFEVAS